LYIVSLLRRLRGETCIGMVLLLWHCEVLRSFASSAEVAARRAQRALREADDENHDLYNLFQKSDALLHAIGELLAPRGALAAGGMELARRPDVREACALLVPLAAAPATPTARPPGSSCAAPFSPEKRLRFGERPTVHEFVVDRMRPFPDRAKGRRRGFAVRDSRDTGYARSSCSKRRRSRAAAVRRRMRLAATRSANRDCQDDRADAASPVIAAFTDGHCGFVSEWMAGRDMSTITVGCVVLVITSMFGLYSADAEAGAIAHFRLCVCPCSSGFGFRRKVEVASPGSMGAAGFESDSSSEGLIGECDLFDEYSRIRFLVALRLASSCAPALRSPGQVV